MNGFVSHRLGAGGSYLVLGVAFLGVTFGAGGLLMAEGSFRTLSDRAFWL